MGRGKRPEGEKKPKLDRESQMGQREWRQAERDLEIARMTLQPRGYFAAAYHAHQAAEKALKAACWHVTGEEPPWNHRLGDVAERISRRSGPVPAGIDEALVRLDPLFGLSRYPSGDLEVPIPAELFGETEALRAIEKAEEIIRWVHELLRLQPERRQPRSP